ncbi:hypothetical protein BOTBODRAFT_182148 [Botryobasidium botryosum FD-172 SS1]|uniref:Uncharacterized protein n=1 Tax=Botryobasidium botryosum (strain FD-172 SS1) TaxID=930990 RepID=A0A067LUG6_BOTB1|nr:hypothetical protein BOTBODRAFT_182148 [Botryobasidium botryosum FD-172 SS1]
MLVNEGEDEEMQGVRSMSLAYEGPFSYCCNEGSEDGTSAVLVTSKPDPELREKMSTHEDDDISTATKFRFKCVCDFVVTKRKMKL